MSRKKMPKTLPELYAAKEEAEDELKKARQKEKMLAIARALMGAPKLLMLDEPSLGLAPVIVEKIYEKLLEINATGLTLIVVEQNANIALEVCDYAYTMVNGQLSISGTREKLIKDETFMHAFLGSQ